MKRRDEKIDANIRQLMEKERSKALERIKGRLMGTLKPPSEIARLASVSGIAQEKSVQGCLGAAGEEAKNESLS